MRTTSKLDLHSGLPYWLARNGLLGEFPELETALPREEIVIIGAGISGALVAHALCRAGFRCTMVDRRLLSSGSTWASTAQLNYEIDSSLSELTELYGEGAAVRIYESNLQAVGRMGQILQEADVDAGYEPKGSLYLASNAKGARQIEAEYSLRHRHGLTVELLDKRTLQQEYGIDRLNALWHDRAAQFDAYRAAAGIIGYHANTGTLKVFTRTEIKELTCVHGGVELRTDKGFRIKAKYVVCAPGYESQAFLPKRVMDINSTYALATQPVAKERRWKDEPLIWETARPYFYMRSTPEGRLIMGGGDEPFKDAKRRDALLDRKEGILLRQCAKLLPQLEGISADFTWCGTFGGSKDGLPYIGEYPGMKRVSFALGYGGNGTTFSVIGAEMICNKLQGKKDDRDRLFSFERGK